MSVTINVLKQLLQSDVPAQDGTPSEEQYERAIKDAVADFGRRAPYPKTGTLNVVSGQSLYDAPLDAVRVLNFVPVEPTGGLLVTDMLTPVFTTTRPDSVSLAGAKLVVSPRPTYSLSRSYEYMASYALTDGQYADLPESAISLILLKARAAATRLKAIKAGGAAIKYAIGDESIDKSGIGRSLSDAAQELDRLYEDAMRQMKPQAAIRSSY